MTKEQMQEFFEKLEGPQGCDFKEDTGCGLTWACAGGNDKRFAVAILEGMDIEQQERDNFLEKCHELGGHCDCEILFNAMERILED